MSKKLITLIERKADEELKAYFGSLGKEKPLDCHEELVLLEHSSEDVILAYINRFRLSEKAEILMLEKVTPHIRLTYINYYGLREETQKFVIERNLLPVAFDFMKMHEFFDVDYLLENGDSEMIRAHINSHALNDEQVEKLLNHDNSSLFTSYVNKGRFISDKIKELVIKNEDYSAFKAIVYHFYRTFKNKSKKARDYKKLMNQVSGVGLSSEQQIMVLSSFNRMFIELLLKTTPLSVKAQDYLIEHNFDASWFKIHVENLYCVGGYRFEGENEAKLFKVLAKKNLDDCLTELRLLDDVSFVKFASVEAVRKYIKNFWLTDDAQVALIEGGNSTIIKELLSRYSPEHGICWQAEVALVSLNSTALIDFYISFHSMCWDALEILKKCNPELHKKYYTLHRY
ncbi:MAG: hypothetical protein IJZ30_04110 [Alphaproteobacteria bacterium]|nr:hypothetical protein [Alphaproteobacteria bacterium]